MKRQYRLLATAAVWGTICGVAGWWVANGPDDVRVLLFLALSVVTIGFAVALAYMEDDRNQWRAKAKALTTRNLSPWEVQFMDRMLDTDLMARPLTTRYARGGYVRPSGPPVVDGRDVGPIPAVDQTRRRPT